MLNPAKLVIVMDTYGAHRIKGLTQKRRGSAGRKVLITERGQSMTQGKDWYMFLNSGENKMELIHFLANHYQSESVRSKLEIPLVFTESTNAWLTTSANVSLLEHCNHHEADTRVVRHASLSGEPVVVVAADTDIFILLLYAFCKIGPAEKWYMKIDKERYVDISKICKSYGKEICDVLPSYHSITGCDTSYPYKVGKVKPFNKMIAQGKFILLNSVGALPLTSDNLENMLIFIQTVMHPGKEGEDYVETRIRMYEKQRVKSSLGLLPDKHSCQEYLKRSNLQAYIWKQCLMQDIDYPMPEDNGWQLTDDGLVPLWFSCSQFPPSLCRKPKKTADVHAEEADDESSDRERKKQLGPPQKSIRKKQLNHPVKLIKHLP